MIEDATTTSGVSDSLSVANHRLCPHERELVGLGGRGATDREIADRLGISISALRNDWARIREKLGAVSRTHAIALAAGAGESAEVDARANLASELARGRVATWVWRTLPDQALLDSHAEELFGLPMNSLPIPADRLLRHIWAPDRDRFARFLSQCRDLRPMTPIEMRVGTPGEYRSLVRTVNLTCAPSGKATVLLATTTIHAFG